MEEIKSRFVINPHGRRTAVNCTESGKAEYVSRGFRFLEDDPEPNPVPDRFETPPQPKEKDDVPGEQTADEGPVEPKDDPLVCKECGKLCKSKAGLARHEGSHK